MTILRLLIFAIIALAGPAYAADVVFPTGSRLGLVPPPGLTASKAFPGFEDPDNNVAIVLTPLPAQAFGNFDKATDAATLKQQGLTLEKREPFALALGKAFLVIVSQEVETIKLHKWIMVVSSPELTAVATVQIPDAARNSYPDEVVRTTLASLALRAEVPLEEQLSLLPFRIGDLAGFRIGGIITGRAVMLTDAPADVSGATTDPQIVVTVSLGGPTQANDRDNFALDTFRAIPNLRDVNIVSAEPLRIGGLPGHQIMARAKETGTGFDVTVVQWLRFGTGGYMNLIAVARSEVWPQAYARFREVRDAIELR